MRVFLKIAAAARGREGGFIHFQFILNLLELLFFPNFYLAVDVSLSQPSPEALVPQAARQEGVTTLLELLLDLF